MSDDEEDVPEEPPKKYLLGFDGRGFYEKGPPNLDGTTLITNILLVTIRRQVHVSLGSDASKEDVERLMVMAVAAGLGDMLGHGVLLTPPHIAKFMHDVIGEFQKGKK